jgi:hypothetical protein
MTKNRIRTETPRNANMMMTITSIGKLMRSSPANQAEQTKEEELGKSAGLWFQAPILPLLFLAPIPVPVAVSFL